VPLNPFRKKKEMPGGLWILCPSCQETIFKKEVEKRNQVCPQCGHHFGISVRERIAITFDPGSFDEMWGELAPKDPLGFVDKRPYDERLSQAEEKTGLKDAAIVGTARLERRPVAFGGIEFGFIGGSMGAIVGEKIARVTELATERRLPLIVVSSSGGARMMEGAISLMQMAKTCAAVERHHAAKLPFISILADPVTGGVMASFASLGDLVIAEPGALIGFAGPRVIQTTIKQELPAGFQRAEFLLAHGFIDRIVSRDRMRDELATILEYCAGPAPAPEPEPAPEQPADPAKPRAGQGA